MVSGEKQTLEDSLANQRARFEVTLAKPFTFFLLLCDSQAQSWVIQKSMSLKYEPSVELLYISAKWSRPFTFDPKL